MSSATMDTLTKVPFRLLLTVAALCCAAVLMGAGCGPSEQAPADPGSAAASTTSGSAPASVSASTVATSGGSAASATAGGATTSGSTGFTGSGGSQPEKATDPSMYAGLSGDIPIDGSSTVFPITEAVAEEFGELTGDNVRVVVGISGTGGGFKKFCTNEAVINNASRPIRQKEIDTCSAAGIEYIELPVAIDGLSVVVNPKNDFVDCLSVEQLNKIWSPESEGVVTHWNQVNPDWPVEEIKMYAPGVDSGTFDYFTEAINGDGGVSRGDFTASEDDNVLVQGVSGDEYSIGYFGYAYYVENKDKVKVVPIDGGNGCIAPTDEAINNGSYAPLSRPLFIYVRSDAAQQDHIAEFVRYYLSPGGQELSASVGYIPFPQQVYDLGLTKFNSGTVGTVFGGDNAFKGPVVDGLQR
ncbi:MAG: PstS family phosphate ABC transporter substrate-binding protein [Chloroflexota bacterium]|nr:PstS family phosphate ABC transporter substrate-binding protein [Chloroflexota bacterium]MDE2961755.1 PstS family phosphate ABC transporter substrate-binding protein [Chloroflexota bacterium]